MTSAEYSTIGSMTPGREYLLPYFVGHIFPRVRRFRYMAKAHNGKYLQYQW